jgi:hypothetical protein
LNLYHFGKELKSFLAFSDLLNEFQAVNVVHNIVVEMD